MRLLFKYVIRLVGWALLIAALALLLPHLLRATLTYAHRGIGAMPHATGIDRAYIPYDGIIAPLFTREVDYWSSSIGRWANEHDLDPNLLATVMQIESCGHYLVSSSAGAQGLFQVMPFHFTTDENQLDPDTNARRGADFLNYCLDQADNDPGLAMACYNGGPGVIWRSFDTWFAETQRYYNWGTTIYADAVQNRADSPALASWLNAGGQLLCDRAATTLRME